MKQVYNLTSLFQQNFVLPNPTSEFTAVSLLLCDSDFRPKMGHYTQSMFMIILQLNAHVILQDVLRLALRHSS